MTPFHDHLQNQIIGVDEVCRPLELKWGGGRLIRLVSEKTRMRFKITHDRWVASWATSDAQAVTDASAGMKRAWAALDQEASTLGHQPLSPAIWEAVSPAGQVVAVVRTAAEASAVARGWREAAGGAQDTGEGLQAAGARSSETRNVIVLTMDEVARLLDQNEALKAILLTWPGSRVSAAPVRAETFAEGWATGDGLVETWHGAPQAPEVAA